MGENLTPSIRSEYLIIRYRQVGAKGVERAVPMSESESESENRNEEQRGARHSIQFLHFKDEENQVTKATQEKLQWRR